MSTIGDMTSLLAWTLAFMRPYRGRMLFVAVLLLFEVVLGALEPWRQHMQQEPADECFDAQRSGLLPIAVRAISIGKTDLPVLTRQQPVIRDRHAVRVASQVVQQFLRAGEWRLGIHDPSLSA